MSDLQDDLQPQTVDLTGCARCHGDGHEQITFEPLTYPMASGKYVFTHWAPCPTNGEPIFFTVIQDGDGS